MNERSKALPLHVICGLLDVSEQAFRRWRLPPLARRGRETLYSWPAAYEMAIKKRTLRPGAGVGLPPQVIDAGNHIVAAANALERDDIAGLTVQLRAMQALVAAAGITEDDITA